VILALVGLSAALAVGQAAAASPSVAAGARAHSWDLARALAEKIEGLERRGKQPEPKADWPVEITQAELNSYLNLSLGEKLPPGLADLEVVLDRGRIAARALVDLEQVKGKAPSPGPWSPLAYLSGRVPLELAGRYRNRQEGFGSFEVEDVRLASFPVPVSLIEQLVLRATHTRDNPKGFDIHAPFRLPYAAKRLRVQKGQARLEF